MFFSSALVLKRWLRSWRCRPLTHCHAIAMRLSRRNGDTKLTAPELLAAFLQAIFSEKTQYHNGVSYFTR